jgi:hypothetical protein
VTFHDAHDQVSDPKYSYLWHSSASDYLKGQRRRKGRPKGASQAKVKAAFREVYTKTPSTVTRAHVTGTRKRKMLAAVAFSKARQAGARIPKR